MPQLTVVKILWCGQGMTTLVECYDDGVEKEQADCLVLIDCGGNVEWGDRALDYVAKKVLATKGRRLDALIISHQDQDHVILLKGLGARLSGKATLGSVYLGGLDWERSNIGTVRNFLAELVYTDPVVFNAPRLSHYLHATTPSNLDHWVRHGDMYIRVLVSGLVATGRPDIRKNASSAVVVVDDGHWSVVLPGDATYQTMSAVNEIQNIGTLLRPVYGLEIPHHGALRTAVEEYVANKDPSQFDYTIVDEFARIVSPQVVAASAGPWNTHHHPVEEVLQRFDSHVVTAPDHTYVSYVFARPTGTTHQGWTEYSDVTLAEHCTVQAIGETAKQSKSTNKAKKAGDNKGEFVFGNVSFLLGGGRLRPEEMVRFEPLGTLRAGPAEPPVPEAPAP